MAHTITKNPETRKNLYIVTFLFEEVHTNLEYLIHHPKKDKPYHEIQDDLSNIKFYKDMDNTLKEKWKTDSNYLNTCSEKEHKMIEETIDDALKIVLSCNR